MSSRMKPGDEVRFSRVLARLLESQPSLQKACTTLAEASVSPPIAAAAGRIGDLLAQGTPPGLVTAALQGEMSPSLLYLLSTARSEKSLAEGLRSWADTRSRQARDQERQSLGGLFYVLAAVALLMVLLAVRALFQADLVGLYHAPGQVQRVILLILNLLPLIALGVEVRLFRGAARKQRLQTLFCQGLGLGLAGGLPLLRSLDLLEADAPERAIRRWARHARNELRSGKSFKEALKVVPAGETFALALDQTESGGEALFGRRLLHFADTELPLRGVYRTGSILLLTLIAVIVLEVYGLGPFVTPYEISSF